MDKWSMLSKMKLPTWRASSSSSASTSPRIFFFSSSAVCRSDHKHKVFLKMTKFWKVNLRLGWITEGRCIVTWYTPRFLGEKQLTKHPVSSETDHWFSLEKNLDCIYRLKSFFSAFWRKTNILELWDGEEKQPIGKVCLHKSQNLFGLWKYQVFPYKELFFFLIREKRCEKKTFFPNGFSHICLISLPSVIHPFLPHGFSLQSCIKAKKWSKENWVVVKIDIERDTNIDVESFGNSWIIGTFRKRHFLTGINTTGKSWDWTIDEKYKSKTAQKGGTVASKREKSKHRVWNPQCNGWKQRLQHATLQLNPNCYSFNSGGHQ